MLKELLLKKRPKLLLDIGGGNCIYSSTFCKKFAGLHADIIDLPQASEIGKTIVADKGYSDRIRFTSGNILKTDWESGYDMVLLFNVIPAVSEKDSKILIKKSYDALSPEGVLLLMDSENNEGNGSISATTGFKELLFYIIIGKSTYPEKYIKKWMKDAGFHEIIRKKLLSIPMSLYSLAFK